MIRMLTFQTADERALQVNLNRAVSAATAQLVQVQAPAETGS